MTTKSPLIGGGSLILSTFLYATFGIYSRIIGETLPLFYQNATRALLACVFIAIFIALRNEWTKISQKDFWWIAVRSIFGMGATTIFVYAVRFIPIGTFYFIFYAGSVLGGYIFGRTLLGDKITMIKIVSLLVASIGLLFIFSVPTSSADNIYLIYALLAGLCVSLFNILSAKISQKNSALVVTLLDNVISVPLYILISLALSEPWIAPAANIVWGANLLFALTMVGTGSLIVYGFRRIDSHIGSLLMLTEILFGALFGFLFYKEVLHTMTLLGGVFIVGAIALVHIRLPMSTPVRNT